MTQATICSRVKGRRVPAAGFAAAVLAALLAGAVAPGCGGGDAVIGQKPFKRVYTVESNVDALRTWTDLKARADVLVHIDSADDIAVFPQAYQDSLAGVAKRLRAGDIQAIGALAPAFERAGVLTVGYMAGMYKRIVWVVPTGRPTGEEPVETYRRFFLESKKLPPEVVGAFTSDGKSVSGSIAGIPLVITRLSELSLAKDETAIVDIDCRYFLLLAAQDRNYRTGTKTLLAFLRELAERGVRARAVTVNLANQDNDVPLDLRFYGSVIKRALEAPKDLGSPVPRTWETMIQAEDSLRAGRYAAAAALYRSIADADPEDPGARFALGMALGFQEKGAEARNEVLAAYRLDHQYLRGFYQLARVLGVSGKVSTGEEILGTPELKTIVGDEELDYQYGLFYFNARRPFDAATFLARVATARPKEFGIQTILFRAYREMGDEFHEALAMQKLVDIDAGRVRREMPWVYADLGALYEKQGFWKNARDLYEDYLAHQPGDSLATALRGRLAAIAAKK